MFTLVQDRGLGHRLGRERQQDVAFKQQALLLVAFQVRMT